MIDFWDICLDDTSPHGDELQTEKLVDLIQSTVLSLVDSTYRHDPELCDSFHKEIDNAVSFLTLRAKALDRIFNDPPREEYAFERNGPSICVYNGRGELELVNGTYLKLIGLESGDEAKELVREGKLIDRIYIRETAKEVREFVESIDATGGYTGKVFPLANGNSARWTSISTGPLSGNVRIAEDITGIRDIPVPFSLRDIEEIPFLFSEFTKRFSIAVEKIVALDPYTEELLKKLQNISRVGDIIVDKWPFCIVVKQGDTYVSVNKNYVAITGYSLQELEQNPELYIGSQAEQVNARLESLAKVEHYYDSFRMLRRDGTLLDTLWDTFRISEAAHPITTIRIGNMIGSAEELEAAEELRKLMDS